MIGQIFAGRYRVLQMLGVGGFGQTYITADLHMPGEPECVLKHLKPDSNDPEMLDLARKLFQKEAETLQQLGNHSQIPRLLAFFEEKQEFYLVQEFIDGHTLSRELLSDQKWTERAVQKLLQEVLVILDFVHSQGVIHRDIKPDNIMRRDADGKLVLIDFGAIKQVRNQQITAGTAPQTIAIGTPGYMSPEQARGNPRPSSDLYALGMIGIQAVSGKYPTEIKEDHDTGELQWQQFAQASPPLIDFLSQMTRYHFRDRYITASQALQALNQIEIGDVTRPLPTATIPAIAGQMPTAATFVVSPAQPIPKQPPVRKNKAIATKDPRLDNPKSSNKIIAVIGSAVLVGASGVGGYLGWAYFKNLQFDSRLNTDQCRLAAPQGNGGAITRIRNSPERNSGVIGTLAAGNKFLYLSSKEPFIEIQQRDGSRGWVFNDQIDSCTGPSLKASPSPQSASPTPRPKPIKSIDNTVIKTPPPAVTYSTAPITIPSITISPSSISIPTVSISPSPTIKPTVTPSSSSSPSPIVSPSNQPSSPLPSN
jgi:serine/threonine protein kinase